VRLVEVFRYELEHRLRSRSTWLYAVLLFAFAVGNGIDIGAIGAVNANAPKALAFNAVIVGLFGVVVSAGLFGDAALRDIEAGMDPLLFTSRLRKIDHLGGRYLAVLVTNALLLLAVPLGFAVPTLTGYPDPAAFGPFRIGAVLQPWLILLLPNMALSGAVLFAVGALGRRLVPVYLTAAGLFLGTLMLSGIGTLVVDPAGMGALEATSLQWTAAEQNTRLIGLPAGLLLNRLLSLAVTGVVLALLYTRFRFAHADGRGAPPGRPGVSEPARPVPLRATRVRGAFGLRTTVRQALTIARNSLAEAAINPWFAGVLLVCGVWSAALAEQATVALFDAATWPVSMLTTAVLSRDFLVFLFVLLGLYAGELVWKDRDLGVAEIADAAPVAEGTALAGRFLALIGMLGMFLAAAMFGAILNQLSYGYHDIEPWLYLRVLFGMDLADGVLIAALVMTVQVLVNNKYFGIIAVLAALVIPFTGPLLRHYLLVYGGDAGWTYSDMNGFGPFLEPFLWFKLYSAGWALLLAVAACLLWVRGRESGVRGRLRQARARFVGSLRRMVGVALGLILLVGGFIFYNTNVLNAFGAADEAAALSTEYQERYGRFENIAQPMIERARLRVEIYPDEPAVDVSGSFHLVNRSGASIDSIHVSSNPRLVTRSISFDRAATAVVTDSLVGYWIYALPRPLAPGDSTRLSFELAFRQRGFPNSGFQTAVVGNGTYIGRGWLPFVGYQPARRPSDFEVRGEGKVRVETIIGTTANQIAIASGVLRREWMENGRRYFQYETEAPQSFDAPVLSGRYAVRAERWNDALTGSGHDVTLAVYHHPNHDRNLDSFVRSMKASLAYYTTHFGPYDASDLRIVEVPRYHREARAHPNMIALSEGRFIAHTREGRIDQVFFGTAQDIAYQWWGGQVPEVHGSEGRLAESLANYIALMVTEQEYDPETARRVHASQVERYFNERPSAPSEASSPGLRHMVAMYPAREYLGEEAVNTALQRFIDKHRAGGDPYPTALDVVSELRAATPDSLRNLLTDLFETETSWDVKTDRAVVEPLATGEYRVTLDVVARKVRANAAGTDIDVPMDDVVEIGVFAPTGASSLGEPLYLKRHRIRSGKQTISITVPQEPARAGIDPYRLLIDRNGRDNVVTAVAGGTGSRPGGP
jgi:hypothetical protein